MVKPIRLANLIEDDEFYLRQSHRILERSRLVEAILPITYADEALIHLQENPDYAADVVFLDINIPRMNGFEFLQEATRTLAKNFASTNVMMLTTSLNPDDRARTESFGVVGNS